ncbi:MAG TPA: TIGR02270 family protein, partial [Myxococcaceae bacterium]|nr:TIGR02270 family protein [Myxococcaceae bacterium]
KGADASLQALALEVLAFRGAAPSDMAMELLRHPDAQVVVAALRGMQLPPQALPQRELLRLLADIRPGVRDAAIEAGMVAGSRAAWDCCRKELEAGAEVGRVPLVLLALGGDEKDFKRLVTCTGRDEQREGALWALGYSGRVEAAEVCLELMARNPLAALAGEAFSAITGLQLEDSYVVPEQEEDALPPLEEDLARSLEHRPEDDLPVPEKSVVVAWWKEARRSYARGTRYLRGRPFSLDGLLQDMEHGPRRRRPLLALELALRSQGACQLHTKAFAPRQRAELARARAMKARLSAHPFPRMSGG